MAERTTPAPDAIDRLLATGGEARDMLLEVAYATSGRPEPVLVDVDGAPCPGAIVDGGATFVAAYAATLANGAGQAVVRHLDKGAMWLSDPTGACARVLSRGKPLAPKTGTSIVFGVDRRPRADACGVAEVDAIVEEYLRDPANGAEHRLRGAVRRRDRARVLAHLASGLPRGNACLALLSAGPGNDDDGWLTVDDLQAIATCAALPNPGWVEVAMRRHPMLSVLAKPPWSTGECASRHLEDLASGKAPLEVALAMLRSVENPHGLHKRASPAVLRSLASHPASVTRSHFAPTAQVRFEHLRSFHRANPGHRALDTAEMDAVDAFLADFGARTSPRDSDLLSSLMHGGRLERAPEHLLDGYRGMRNSLEALRGIIRLNSVWKDIDAAAMGVAFPPRRRMASLRRIDREWHASQQAHAENTAMARASALARVTGRTSGLPHAPETAIVTGDVTITPLRDWEDYVREGREMGHCVGSFAERAAMAEVVCVSLRDTQGRSSTASYEILADPPRLHPGQHKGPGNRVPHPSHVAALLDERHLDAMAGSAHRLANERRSRREALDKAPITSRDYTPGERERLVRSHFAQVGLWLSDGETAAGPGPLLDHLVSTDVEPRRNTGGKLRRMFTPS